MSVLYEETNKLTEESALQEKLQIHLVQRNQEGNRPQGLPNSNPLS